MADLATWSLSYNVGRCSLPKSCFRKDLPGSSNNNAHRLKEKIDEQGY